LHETTEDADETNFIIHRGERVRPLNLFPYNGHLYIAPYEHVATRSRLA
jgi:hypothetical protein